MISPSSSTARSSRALGLMLTAALASAIALAPALPAFAHSELLESTPAAGATLSQAPGQVQLVFGEDVEQQGGAIVVQAGDGSRVDQANTFATDANVATVQLTKTAPSGKYTVNFRVVSADGHVVSDTFSYRVESSATETPSPTVSATSPATTAGTSSASTSPLAATGDSDEGSSVSAVWVLGLGAIGLVLVAAMIAVVVRGRRDSSD